MSKATNGRKGGRPEWKLVWKLFRNYALSAPVCNAFSESETTLFAGLAILTAKNEVGRDILINNAREVVGRWARWEVGGSIQQNEASVGGLRFCRGSGAQCTLVHGGMGSSIPAERPWEETGCRDGRTQLPGPNSAHQCLTFSADSWPYHSREMWNPGQRWPALARCCAQGLNCEQRLQRGQCEHSLLAAVSVVSLTELI